MGCSSSGTSSTVVELRKQWDYWDNCGGSVIAAGTDGVPAPPGGSDRVVKWTKPKTSNAVYQKLNRSFTKDNWPMGVGSANTQSPADVSGIYTVYQYIPSARFTLNPGHGWVIFSEFKENYYDSSGTWRQDPTWQFGCNNFSGPVRCSLVPHSTPTFSLTNYMDRWVKWEYRLYQGSKDTSGRGGRIELWADGVKLDTGYNSERKVGSAAFGSLANTRAWIWIAGQYSSNQGSDSQGTDITSYVGPSSVRPL
jgi:hypothetical protein